MKLNYIYQLNGFIDWTEDHIISDGAFRLYIVILHTCNEHRFVEELEITNRRLQSIVDMRKTNYTEIEKNSLI